MSITAFVTVGGALLLLGATIFVFASGMVGSEFLPHLDDGSIWVRGTLASSTGPTEGERVMHAARKVLAAYPEVIQVVSQVGPA